MSTVTPPKPPADASSPVLDDASRAQLVHNVSVGALVVCPILIFMPPRKFDIYTIALMGSMVVSGNHLTYEYTGRSFLARMKARMASLQSMSEGRLPEKAMAMQIRLRQERERREMMQQAHAIPAQQVEEAMEESPVLDEVRRKREEAFEEEKKERSVLQKVWMGDEGHDWKAKRDQKEREALEEGKGYADLIMDQIWEVWNWGKERAGNVKEKDEEVAKQTTDHKAKR